MSIKKRISSKDQAEQQEGVFYPGVQDPGAYINPITIYQRKGHFFHFVHVPTNKMVSLPAIVMSLQESYTSNFRREPAYGRMDPITGFQNTQRTINVTLKVVAGTYKEAKHNYNLAFNQLSNMLYPTYKRIGGYRVIAEPPLIAMKHVQLISGPGKSTRPGYLVGTVNGVSLINDFGEGAFEDSTDGNDVYPRFITLSFTFQVLHDYDRGFDVASNDDPDDVAAPQLGEGGVGSGGEGPKGDENKIIGIPKTPKDPVQEGEANLGEPEEGSNLSESDRADPPSAGDADSPPINTNPEGDILGDNEGGTIISIDPTSGEVVNVEPIDDTDL